MPGDPWQRKSVLKARRDKTSDTKNDVNFPEGKTMGMSLTDQAIRFLEERRWPMLPSTGPEKKPCVGWKRFQELLPTVDQLVQWGQNFKPERWGVVTGGLAA